MTSTNIFPAQFFLQCTPGSGKSLQGLHEKVNFATGNAFHGADGDCGQSGASHALLYQHLLERRGKKDEKLLLISRSSKRHRGGLFFFEYCTLTSTGLLTYSTKTYIPCVRLSTRAVQAAKSHQRSLRSPFLRLA